MWLPVDGEVVAKIPPRKGNRRWLHKSVRIRSPDLDGDRRYLRRSCLTRLVIAAVERYGPWSLGTWRSCRAAPGPVWTRQGWTAVARAWDCSAPAAGRRPLSPPVSRPPTAWARSAPARTTAVSRSPHLYWCGPTTKTPRSPSKADYGERNSVCGAGTVQARPHAAGCPGAAIGSVVPGSWALSMADGSIPAEAAVEDGPGVWFRGRPFSSAASRRPRGSCRAP